MSQKSMLDFRLARRLAVEKQLLAEEKWVLEALNLIKKQRNSLQMERLHLNSLLAKLILKRKGLPQTSHEEDKSEEPAPQQLDLDLPSFLPDDLNLTVPQHDYSDRPVDSHTEEMEEYENEEMDMDDYEIDMNMLMNGNVEHDSGLF